MSSDAARASTELIGAARAGAARDTVSQGGPSLKEMTYLVAEGYMLSEEVVPPVSNAEAAQLLQGTNSGLHPDLSRRGYCLAKRTFDIVASLVAIALLLIPSLVLCIAICIASPGACPFYCQWRAGRLNKDGTYRLFRMWKFRSMIPHADKMLEGLQDKNEADGPLFKIKKDPRVIPGVGAFIRRHSIDELPQLINVFKGDMSLIGPRPGLPSEVMRYGERTKQRLTVKPGCGGIWQAGPRSDSAFAKMVELDLDYVAHRSIAFDIKLILGTLRTMLTGKGAY